jgi:hypothetical protein
MIRSLRKTIHSVRSVRITRPQLGGVIVFSALASALVITSALGRSAALAAPSHHEVALRAGTVGGSTGSSAGTSSSSTGPILPASGTAPTPVASTSAATSAPNSAPSTTPSTQSGSGGGSGGGSQGNGGSGGGHKHKGGGGKGSNAPKHKVGHVWVIALSTPSFDDAWGSSSPATYLNKTLKRKGAFLGGYETLGSAELPDYLAMVSGQPPNSDTERECSTYAEFPSGTAPNASTGLVGGNGCIYPNTIITIADQATAAGGLWRGYADDLLPPSTCVHPNSNALDNVELTGAGPQYDTRHNPFIYFHSLLDLGGCSENDVTLSQLPKDLKSVKSSPTYSFLAPGLCDDGSATSCPAGAPAGVAGEDAFLRQWVPAIEKSAAYKKDGVIIIAFALSGGTAGGSSAPTGALVLSRWAQRGKTFSTTYNPYSILASCEDLLGYTPLLAKAKSAPTFLAQALPGT